MRLIDAEKLDWWYKGRNIRRIIDDAPTVDAVVVTRCKDCAHLYGTLCTNCGCALTESKYRLYTWDYCPICGAKMDGGDNDAKSV